MAGITPDVSTEFKPMLWKGQMLFGMMLFDEIRALDYLASRPEADAQRPTHICERVLQGEPLYIQRIRPLMALVDQ